MEFVVELRGANKVIVATGEIRRGDAAKFQQIAHLATPGPKGLRGILLRSPGGSVEEAKQIATIIETLHFVTAVDGDCASACSMILYPAGKAFLLLNGGRLGFHPCFDARDQREVPECTEAIATLAASRGLPYGSVTLFASLVETSGMFWITNVLSPCYGLERFPGDAPPTSYTVPCPHAILTMIRTGGSNARGEHPRQGYSRSYCVRRSTEMLSRPRSADDGNSLKSHDKVPYEAALDRSSTNNNLIPARIGPAVFGAPRPSRT
jgi:hypothetical protein